MTELEVDSEDVQRARQEGSEFAIIGDGMNLVCVGELGDLRPNLKKGKLDKSNIELKRLRTLELEP